IESNFSRSRKLPELYRSVSTLARTVQCLNSHPSFPLLLGIITFISPLLISFASLWFKRLDTFNLYFLEFILHLVGIITADVLIQRRLVDLGRQVIEVQQQSFRGSNPEAVAFWHLKNQNLVEVYSKQLQLRIFSLVKVNLSFLLSLVLFIVNYTVLITSTST